MKLQYRETKWWAGEVPNEPTWHEIPATPDSSDWEIIDEQKEEYQNAIQLATSQFIEIAPENQFHISQNIWYPPDDGIGKLYDLGDLEFELKEQCQHKGIHNSTCAYKQFWV